MAPERFSAHSFDPETLRALYTAFDAAWKSVERHTDAANTASIRDAIALAIVHLASVGQLDPRVLETYAVDRAQAALGMSVRRAS